MEEFYKMGDDAKKVSELFHEISEASREQSQGIEQINSAVAQMDKVIQQNASHAEESASASEVMNAQAVQRISKSINGKWGLGKKADEQSELICVLMIAQAGGFN